MNVHKLSDRAMLINLSFKQWTGKHKDKGESERVAVQANAASDAVDCIINAVPPAELKPLNARRSRAQRIHKMLTLPWTDEGPRILASQMYFTYRDEMKKPLAEYDETLRVFAEERFPKLVADAPSRLGKLASKVTMPPAEHIKYRFRYVQDIQPLANIADFRADWADELEQDIVDQVTANYQGLTKKALQEVWLRLSTFIEKIAATMGERDKRFHDTIITNLKDFCTLMPKFNITEDENLEQIRKEAISKLAELDPEDLREIPNNRKKAAKDAKELMNKISQYIK